MNGFLVWINFSFYPIFGILAFMDYLGNNFFQGFLAALSYTVICFFAAAIFTIGYIGWEVQHSKKDVNTYMYTLRSREWLAMQYTELAIVSISLWKWYSANKTSTGIIKLAYDLPVEAYVDWMVIDLIIVALIPYHIFVFGRFETARQMLSYSPDGSKED